MDLCEGYFTALFLLWTINSPKMIALGVNIALGKITRQSSTMGGNYGSENAVDGRTYSSDTCTLTSGGDYSPWWVVDLGDIYNITNVIIYNHQSTLSIFLDDYFIDVFDIPACFCDKWAEFSRGRQSRCHYQSANVPVLNATCQELSIGRFVQIRRRTFIGAIGCCEVEVYGNLVSVPRVTFSSRKACGFPKKEYAGIDIATVKARSNAECASMCITTDGCCAGVYEKSSQVCTLRRKLDGSEETSHSLENIPSKTSWLV